MSFGVGLPPRALAALHLRIAACVAAAAAASVLWLDVPLARWVHGFADTAVVDVFRVVTAAGDATAYVVVALAVILAVRAGARVRRLRLLAARLQPLERTAVCVLLSLAASGIAVNLLKGAFGRARPQALFAEDAHGFSLLAFEMRNLTSFPSGHSQTIWAVVAVLMILHPRWRWAFAAAGIAVSLSRIVIAAHYAGDVIAGTYVGIAGAVLVCAVALGRSRAAPRGAGIASPGF